MKKKLLAIALATTLTAPTMADYYKSVDEFEGTEIHIAMWTSGSWAKVPNSSDNGILAYRCQSGNGEWMFNGAPYISSSESYVNIQYKFDGVKGMVIAGPLNNGILVMTSDLDDLVKSSNEALIRITGYSDTKTYRFDLSGSTADLNKAKKGGGC